MKAGLSVPLEEIQDCFQGAIPSPISSVDANGVPNITYLSIVHYLDECHVGLSRQFFNKTAANMLVNPRLRVLVVDPYTGCQFKLILSYQETVQEGPLFERVRAQLDAVASQSGMSKVFKLAGVDICEVLACERVPSDIEAVSSRPAPASLPALDAFSARIGSAESVDQLITSAVESLSEDLGYEHVFLLMPDQAAGSLFTVASRGYESSGVGSEVRFGEGIIGLAAQRREAISIANVRKDMIYSQAIRAEYERASGAEDLEREIELPGLTRLFSELVVPVVARDQLLAVFCLQSDRIGRFLPTDENIVKVAARQVGLAMALLREGGSAEARITAEIADRPEQGKPPVIVRHYPADDSIFLDHEYLIRGVAGAVLWRLLRVYEKERRTDFTNREVRVDPSLDLPHYKDNLETRLILLRRRLAERCDFLQIVSTGRGRFRLVVDRQLVLDEVETSQP